MSEPPPASQAAGTSGPATATGQATSTGSVAGSTPPVASAAASAPPPPTSKSKKKKKKNKSSVSIPTPPATAMPASALAAAGSAEPEEPKSATPISSLQDISETAAPTVDIDTPPAAPAVPAVPAPVASAPAEPAAVALPTLDKMAAPADAAFVASAPSPPAHSPAARTTGSTDKVSSKTTEPVPPSSTLLPADEEQPDFGLHSTPSTAPPPKASAEDSAPLLLPADEEQPDFGLHSTSSTSAPFAAYEPMMGVPAPAPANVSSLFSDDAEGMAFEESTDPKDNIFEATAPVKATSHAPVIPKAAPISFSSDDAGSEAFDSTATLDTTVEAAGVEHEKAAKEAPAKASALFDDDSTAFDISASQEEKEKEVPHRSEAPVSTVVGDMADEVQVSDPVVALAQTKVEAPAQRAETVEAPRALFSEDVESIAFDIPTQSDMAEGMADVSSPEPQAEGITAPQPPKPLSMSAAALFADDAEGMAFDIEADDAFDISSEATPAQTTAPETKAPEEVGKAASADVAEPGEKTAAVEPIVKATAAQSPVASRTAQSLFADDSDAFDAFDIPVQDSPAKSKAETVRASGGTPPTAATKSAAALFSDDASDGFDIGQDPEPASISSTDPSTADRSASQKPHEADVSIQSMFSNNSDWLVDTSADDSFDLGRDDNVVDTPMATTTDSNADADMEVPQGWYDDNGEWNWYTEEEREAVRVSMFGEQPAKISTEQSGAASQQENAARRTTANETSTAAYAPAPSNPYAPPPANPYAPVSQPTSYFSYNQPQAPAPASNIYSPAQNVASPAPYAPSAPSSVASPYAPPLAAVGYSAQPYPPAATASPYNPYAPTQQALGYGTPSASVTPGTAPVPSKPSKPAPPQRVMSNAYDPPLLLKPKKSFVRSASAAPIEAFGLPANAPSMASLASPAIATPPAPPPGPPKRTRTQDRVPTMGSQDGTPPRSQSAAPSSADNYTPDPYAPAVPSMPDFVRSNTYDPSAVGYQQATTTPAAAGYERTVSPPAKPPARPSTAGATHPPPPTSFDPPLRQTASRPSSRHGQRPAFAPPPTQPPVPAIPAAFIPPPKGPGSRQTSPMPGYEQAPANAQPRSASRGAGRSRPGSPKFAERPPPVPPLPPASAVTSPPYRAASPSSLHGTSAYGDQSLHDPSPYGNQSLHDPSPYNAPPRAATPPRSASPHRVASPQYTAPPRISSPLKNEAMRPLAMPPSPEPQPASQHKPKESLSLHEEFDPEGGKWGDEEPLPSPEAPSHSRMEPPPFFPRPPSQPKSQPQSFGPPSQTYDPAPHKPALKSEQSSYQPHPAAPKEEPGHVRDSSQSSYGFGSTHAYDKPAVSGHQHTQSIGSVSSIHSSSPAQGPSKTEMNPYAPPQRKESASEYNPYAAPSSRKGSAPEPYNPYAAPSSPRKGSAAEPCNPYAAPSSPRKASQPPTDAYNPYAQTSPRQASQPPADAYNPYAANPARPPSQPAGDSHPRYSPVSVRKPSLPAQEYNPCAANKAGAASHARTPSHGQNGRDGADAPSAYAPSRKSTEDPYAPRKSEEYNPYASRKSVDVDPYARKSEEYNPYAAPPAPQRSYTAMEATPLDPYAPTSRSKTLDTVYSPATDPYGGPATSPKQGRSSAAPSYFQAMPVDPTYVPQQVLEQRPVSEDPLGRCSVAAHNVPIARFGFGGYLVTGFPGGADDDGTRGYGYASHRGQLTVRPIPEVADASALSSNATPFPGPLVFDVATPKGAAGEKKRREAVMTYLTSRAEEIENGLPYLKSSASRKRREEEAKLVVVRILRALIEGDGRLFGTSKAEEAIREALKAPDSNSQINQAINGLGASSSSGVRASAAQLKELSSILMGGGKADAAQYAANAGLWSHALVISSSVGPELWREMVTRFSTAELASNNQAAGLKAAYAVYSGITPATIEDLFKTANTEDSSSDQWRDVVAAVFLNGKATDLICLDDLGKRFQRSGFPGAAQVCFLLSPNSAFNDMSHAAGERPVMLVENVRDEDGGIFAEIAEYARSLVPTPKGVEAPHASLPQLLPYKLQRAWHAAELGEVDQAKRYCDAIEASVKPSKSQPRAVLPRHIAASMEDLLERLTGSPSVDPSGGLGIRKSKSGATIGSWIEGRLTKFIAGEDDAKAPVKPAAPAAKGSAQVPVGPFSHFSSISPGPSAAASRAASAVDVPITGSMSSHPESYMPPPSGGSSYSPWGTDEAEGGSPVAPPMTSVPTVSLNTEQEDLINPMAGIINPMGVNLPSAPATDYNPPSRSQQLEVEDDDEDLGFGNTSLSRGRTPKAPEDQGAGNNEDAYKPAPKAAAKAEPPKETKTEPSKAEQKGWLRGWFGGKKEGEGSGPIRAKLGDESSMIYDNDLKRWVVKGAKGEKTIPTATPPPPSRARTASPATFNQPAPMQRASSAAPPNRPPASSSATPPPPVPPMPSGMPPSRTGSGSKPPGGTATPPTGPPTGLPKPGGQASLDDLLSRPSSGRPTSAAAKKKRAHNKYVDVFQGAGEQ